MEVRVSKITKIGKVSFDGPMRMELAEVFLHIGFVPLHYDQMVAYDMTVVSGYCDQFRDLVPGEMIPEYTVKVTRDRGKISEISVSRITI